MDRTQKKPTVIWTRVTDMRKSPDQQKSERITPERILWLDLNEVFVFGSDREGTHSIGASRIARERFGALRGTSEGPQGQCYAIPTEGPDVECIRPFVDRFTEYARSHPGLRFLVTPVGCGAAGHTPNEIAPLFIEASDLRNVCLPEAFWAMLNR